MGHFAACLLAALAVSAGALESRRTAAVPLDRRRHAARALRGGASKAKKFKGAAKALDPTGTPAVVKLLRPVNALCDKYDAAVESNPMLGFVGQMALTFGSMRAINTALDKTESPRPRSSRACSTWASSCSTRACCPTSSRSSSPRYDAATLPGNPMLAALAKKQADGGDAGGVAGALVDKLTSKETTVRDYDLDMVKKGRNSQPDPRAMCFLHIKKGMVQPLVAQAVMGVAASPRHPQKDRESSASSKMSAMKDRVAALCEQLGVEQSGSGLAPPCAQCGGGA
ncbi:hypothetical protein JL721_11663 [Aureococcus anophagefferens]|nr:hypothetical protein JL721_11663 [Aureococcus anophagefferens]